MVKLTIPLPLFIVKKAVRRFKEKAQWQDIHRSRAGFEKLTKKSAFESKDCIYKIIDINHCKAEWVYKESAINKGVLLYFHGGGYNAGSLNTHRTLLTKLALESNKRILSLDYRLAPENPYPAALQDAVMAYQWLIDSGIQPTSIALGGDSAGGGLTLATLLYLRDHHMPLPSCAITLSPWTDLSMSGDTFLDDTIDEPMLIKEAFTHWAQNYISNESAYLPYISPVFGELSNLCPVYIQVGSAEALLSDSTRFYEKAHAAGSPVKMDIFKNYFHVFQSFWQILPKAKKAIKMLGDFLNQHIQD